MADPDEKKRAVAFLEAAFFGGEELPDQATADLSADLPLIEGYRLRRLLGEGGFGMVYEGEQLAPIRRRVAVKVLRPGCATRELLARFEQERQVLALLSHPFIAKVHDAGETEDGRPFIAMELVKGSTIDRHARGLTVREKAALMRDVCRAVGHAHHKGIIHRDLKPSNILITRPEDGPPQPRVIDFGIAKALDGPLSAQVMFTQIRQVVGTPGYMSPERHHTSQIRHSADTRADVFALGAVLWELLTGSTPAQSPLHGETRVTLPAARSVPAELRWITTKATDSAMERRYANADALADDLDRYLEARPLVAAPPSALYVAGKWARRNRALASVILVSGLALLAAAALLLRSYQQTRAALAEARESRSGMLAALSRADLMMGMTRTRGRPVPAMAQWARALRMDPANRAALGMTLATWGHRVHPRVAAPAARLPEGRVRRLELSPDGRWAALLMAGADGATQIAARCRRGEAEMEAAEIPADGIITHLAVSNEGIVAVAGASGPAGILRRGGAWEAGSHEVAGMAALSWDQDGVLWLAGAREVAWCDSTGAQAAAPFPLPARLLRWQESPSGTRHVAALEGGTLALFSRPGAVPELVRAPFPAPVLAVAAAEAAPVLAASWRNGVTWVSQGPDAEPLLHSGGHANSLRFARDGSHIAAADPWKVRMLPARAGTQAPPAWEIELERPLRTLTETLPGHWLVTPTYGPPELRTAAGSIELPGFGTQIHAAADAAGAVIAMADAEHGALEWLHVAAPPAPAGQPSLDTTPRALTPAVEGGWTAVDEAGWVCQISPQGAVTRGWRCTEAELRLAGVDAAGAAALLELKGAGLPHVVREGGGRVDFQTAKPSALALSPAGSLAVLGFPSGETFVHDTLTGARLALHDWQSGPVTAAAFVTEEKIALAFNRQIHVWEWRAGVASAGVLDFPGRINALAPGPVGARLAAAGEGALHVMDLDTGLRVVGALDTPPDTACLAWEPDGRHLWSCAPGGAVMRTPMPPHQGRCPDWLPEFIERRLGMRVDDQGRVVRLFSSAPLPAIPADADPALKAWLER